MLTNTQSIRPTISWTGTSKLEQPAELISGTAISIAGAGINLTNVSPQNCSTIEFTFRTPTIVGVHFGSKPRIQRRRRRTRKIGHNSLLTLQEITANIAKLAFPEPKKRIVLLEQIRAVGDAPSVAPVRLIGKKGTALRPSQTSYDVDLDEFQS
jgi:hypothetical protein